MGVAMVAGSSYRIGSADNSTGSLSGSSAGISIGRLPGAGERGFIRSVGDTGGVDIGDTNRSMNGPFSTAAGSIYESVVAVLVVSGRERRDEVKEACDQYGY